MNMHTSRSSALSVVFLATTACGSIATTAGDPAPAAPAAPVESAAPVAPSAKAREVFTRSPFGRTDVADNLVLDGDFEFTGRSGQMPWLTFSQRGQQSLTFETGGRCISGVRCAKLAPGTVIYGWLASPASGRFKVSLRAKPTANRCAALSPIVVDFADGVQIARIGAAAAAPDASGWCTYAVETDAFTGKQSGIYLEVSDSDANPSLLDDAVAAPVPTPTPGNPIAASGLPYMRHERPVGRLAEELTWLGDYLKSHRRFGRPELPLDNPPRATK
jgi:hypothetical protein